MATGASKIKIWDVASLQTILELEGHPNTRIDTVNYDRTATRLLSAGWDDHLAKIWDASTGRLLVTLEGHMGRLMTASFSPDRNYVVTGAFDQTARLWDARIPVDRGRHGARSRHRGRQGPCVGPPLAPLDLRPE